MAILTVGITLIAWTWRSTRPPSNPPASKVPTPVPLSVFARENLTIHRGDTLASLLERAGVETEKRVALVAAVEEAFDVRKLRAGSQLTLVRSSAGMLESLEYVLDPDHKLEVAKSNGTFAARVAEIPGSIHLDPVCGTLHGSLFESVETVGERPELALRLAEIFAWDIDFYRDPQPGDEFCVLVEKKEYADRSPATYRSVLAATYNNAGTVYDAYLFPDDDGEPRYYSADGQSLQSAFLRSPLEFNARVSSHFSRRRLHPVLGHYRPHWGTDYAAPTGTPVRAVAAGRVVFSGLSGGSGNLISIRHANGFETQYLHLSRRLVRVGQRVKQGQRIGRVGATGLATGPHLDLRVRQNGKYLNFETLKPPRQSKISAEQKESFDAIRERYSALMTSGSQPPERIAAGGSSSGTTQ